MPLKRPRRQPARVSAGWKVAYADLTTAMMAFFLVLWLVEQDRAVRLAVADYFRDPIGFDRSAEAGPSPLGREGGGTSPIDGMLSAPPRTTPDEADASREALERAAKRLQLSLEQLPSFQALGRFVELELDDDGLRVDLVEQDGSSFFARGGGELSAEGAEIVRAIGRELALAGRDVVLEGHTDAVPFRGRASYSNWELSADRANSARRALEAGGVAPARVRAVRGHADQRLRIPEAPADPRNRRVAILVEALPTARDAGARPTPE